jgi:hypothetical protein
MWKPPPREERLAKTLSCPQLRANTAVLAQQAAGKIPGYSGYIPAKDAENVFAGTYANVGEMAAEVSVFRANQRHERYLENETRKEAENTQRLELARSRSETRGEMGKNAHRTFLNRNYWVPSVPGYAGYVPAVRSENVFGRTFAEINEKAQRSVAIRSEPQLEVPLEQKMAAVFKQYREHCARPIPGYHGHIPGKVGESIFGFRFPVANALSAEARHYEDFPTFPHP